MFKDDLARPRRREKTGSAQDARRPWLDRIQIRAAAMVLGATLAGCASSAHVVGTEKPGTYQVAASATGGRMAWARAHEHALNEARDYCEQRGMQVSVTTETVSGVQMLTQHDSSVNFECHPRF